MTIILEKKDYTLEITVSNNYIFEVVGDHLFLVRDECGNIVDSFESSASVQAVRFDPN